MKNLILFFSVWGLVFSQAWSRGDLVNLGLVGIKSTHGVYLQAHTDGELHASNSHRNEEETWFLIEIDKGNHIYALQNWRTGNFMSKQDRGCAPASSTVLGDREKWVLVSGRPFGDLNAVAIKSAFDGTFLGANRPGDNDRDAGGEVAAHGSQGPERRSDWPGWWVFEPAQSPSPGRDVWNTIGGTFQGIANKITPTDVASLIALLAS